MAWNPEKYNEFKTLRYKPFFDLIAHIQDKPNMKVVDLGCGTGELTNMLSEKLTNPSVKGIDSSKEMLEKAKEFTSIQFDQKTIEEQINTREKWDLVFANASIQWVDNHEELFPKIISLLNPDGQLAIQMPCQNENLLNQIVIELVQEEPYKSALNNWKRLSPVLTMDDYAQILFENGGTDMVIYQKVYPMIAKSHDELYEFILGSTLVPYFERLEGAVKEQFIKEFKKRIEKRFSKTPSLYAFKRILLYAKF
ncbi:methyltransferase domain-containing protein [Flavobacterium sp. AJR]|uniref:methyltransferase domain-containing protein n=1 Tax=Flavobacterium sp. AJR TaxID=1979369 RepID=UPI000A3D88AF|nr:methyltransferase domain-containing protein [Flavobacterium sp. AJR]OUL63631.1 trans-aconitate methyltransferase [Flavobacterium sp. AJR]